jgi:hypothetical protein
MFLLQRMLSTHLRVANRVGQVIICVLGVLPVFGDKGATILMKCENMALWCMHQTDNQVTSVDIIVQLDACFKHKRRNGKGDQHDPSHMHPETVFVPKEDVASMEEFVDSIRPKTTKKTTRAEEEQDGFEGPMKVPSSVLDECYSSFLAADEKCQKASTQLFSDTGLMALLCRHDCVLWLVNMTSAGERQHYALALLNTLFKHLPSEIRVGLLYDIGCQLHRSCIKWDFLKEFQDRLTFGISVFHAYGHQWPCQMIYHPRKCHGFGLTDGKSVSAFGVQSSC